MLGMSSKCLLKGDRSLYGFSALETPYILPFFNGGENEINHICLNHIDLNQGDQKYQEYPPSIFFNEISIDEHFVIETIHLLLF